jgi:hypothetical protein
MAITACGSDDGGGDGGSVEGFCEELEAFATNVDDADDESFVADFRVLVDAAPSEIAGELNQMLEAFEQLDELPDEPETEEEMNEMLALAGTIEEPAAAVEEFAIENCPDLPPSVFGG